MVANSVPTQCLNQRTVHSNIMRWDQDTPRGWHVTGLHWKALKCTKIFDIKFRSDKRFTAECKQVLEKAAAGPQVHCQQELNTSRLLQDKEWFLIALNQIVLWLGQTHLIATSSSKRPNLIDTHCDTPLKRVFWRGESLLGLWWQ